MNIDTNRATELKDILMARRLELDSVVHTSIRDGRQRNIKDVGEIGEDSSTVHQADLDLSLLQMRAGTLNRIDEALTRLAANQYGICAVCSRQISERRLRALPFAVRCTRCEDRREENGDRHREFTKKGVSPALVADAAGA